MIIGFKIDGGASGFFYSSNLQYKHNRGLMDEKELLIVKFKIYKEFVKELKE